MSQTRRTLGRLAATARGAGVHALAADLTIDYTCLVEVEVAVTVGSVFNQHWMGGNIPLNDGVALVAGRAYTFTILCAAADTLNFTCDAAVTYTKLIVHEISGDA